MNRINYIDWLKGFAIFTVVLGHVWMRTYSQYWLIYRFHMVLFMTISGYLFNGRRNFKDFLVKKIKSLIVPYLVFSIISILVSVLMLGGRKSPLEYALCIFLGGKFCGVYNNFTLWYLPLIFVVSVIMYFVVNRFKKWYYPIMIVSFAVSVPLNIFSRVIFHNNYLPFSFQVIPSALVCMMSGFLLKEKGYTGVFFKNRHLNAVSAIVIGLVGFAINIGRRDTIINVCSYLYVPSALMICHMIVCLTKNSYNKIVCFLGKNSLYIFGIHRIILHVIEKRTDLESWLVSVRITGFTASVFISIAVIMAISVFIILFKYAKNYIYRKKHYEKNNRTYWEKY